MSSRVSALEARLSEEELKNKQKLQARQDKYEARLKRQRSANIGLAAENTNIAGEVHDIRAANEQTRKRSQELQKENRLWLDDWNVLQRNLSTALEFTSQTLESINKEVGAPDILVLTELAQEEEKVMKKTRHEHRWDDIVMKNSDGPEPERRSLASILGTSDDIKLSLLSTAISPSPKSILRVLSAGLEDMAKEQRKNEKALDDHYNTLFDSENRRHSALLAEQHDIKACRDDLLRISGRLQAALDHLEGSNHRMEQQGHALRLYAQRLGIRSLPPLRGLPPDTALAVAKSKPTYKEALQTITAEGKLQRTERQDHNEQHESHRASQKSPAAREDQDDEGHKDRPRNHGAGEREPREVPESAAEKTRALLRWLNLDQKAR